MDVSRPRVADWVAGAAGALALVAAFLPWYEDEGGRRASGWESFAVIDLLVALAALMALATLAATLAQPTGAVPITLASLTSLVAIVALVAVLIRLVAEPGGVGPGAAPLLGAWLGAIGLAGIAAAGWASITDEHPRGTPPPAPEPELRRLPAGAGGGEAS